MRITYLVLVGSLLIPLSARAQSATDYANTQRLLSAVEAQRNQALTQHAMAEAKVLALTEEVGKLSAKIKDLEAKPKEEK